MGVGPIDVYDTLPITVWSHQSYSTSHVCASPDHSLVGIDCVRAGGVGCACVSCDRSLFLYGWVPVATKSHKSLLLNSSLCRM